MKNIISTVFRKALQIIIDAILIFLFCFFFAWLFNADKSNTKWLFVSISTSLFKNFKKDIYLFFKNRNI